jgi:hypothetical protein
MQRTRSTHEICRVLRSCVLVLLLAVIVPGYSEAQSRIVGMYTFPATPIKGFQNTIFPGSVANDRKVLLGSVGSDLWRGPADGPSEFWMLTDRGPNGQIKVDGKNRRTFWVPEFNPAILRIKLARENYYFFGGVAAFLRGDGHFRKLEET